MSEKVTCRCGESWVPDSSDDAPRVCRVCGAALPRRRSSTEGFSARAPVAARPAARELDDRPIFARPRRRPPPKQSSSGHGTYIVGLIIIVGLVIGIVAFVVVSRRTRAAGQSEYYCDWNRRWGKPHGVGPLDEVTARASANCVEFVRRNGAVVEVKLHGPSLTPAASWHPETMVLGDHFYALPLRESRFEFEYDALGNITMETAYDVKNQFLWSKVYNSPGGVEFINEGGDPLTPSWLGAPGLKILWTPNGLEQELQLLDKDGSPTKTYDGVAVIRQKHDLMGFVAETTWFNEKNEPVAPTNRGYYGYQARFDNRGGFQEIVTLDAQGMPVLNRAGFAIMTMSDVPALRMQRFSYFDPARKPIKCRGQYASRTATYNSWGTIAEEYYDEQGRPIQVNGMVAWRGRRDPRGNLTEMTCLGPGSVPTPGPQGWVNVKRNFDLDNRMLAEEYYDDKYNPVRSKAGFHRQANSYSPQGYLTSLQYFDTDKKPVLVSGFASWFAVYDSMGCREEIIYYGVDGQPKLQSSGWAGQRTKYNADGLATNLDYLGEDLKPILLKEGYAQIRYSYKDKRLADTSFFGVAGEPVLNSDGVHRIEQRYDSKDRYQGTCNYGIDGRRCQNKSGWSRSETKYDDAGRLSESAYYDVNDQLVVGKEGHARLVYERTREGYLAGRQWLDPKGRLLAQADGVAKIRTKVDSKGRAIEETHFDAAGKPTAGPDGAFRVTFQHGDNYEIREVAYFDPTGKPVNGKNGYARAVATMVATRAVDRTFYNHLGKKVTAKVRISAIHDGDDDQEHPKLKKGDVIISLNGTPVRSSFQFWDLQRVTTSGEILLMRDGKEVRLTLDLGFLDLDVEDFVP